MRNWRLLVTDDIVLHGIRVAAVLAQAITFLYLAFIFGMEQFGNFSLIWVITQAVRDLAGVGGPAFLLQVLSRRVAERDGLLPVAPYFFFAIFCPLTVIASVVFFAWVLPLDLLVGEFVKLAPLGQLPVAIAAFAFMHNLVWATGSYIRVMFGAATGMMYRDVLPYLILALAALALSSAGEISVADFLISAAVAMLGIVVVTAVFVAIGCRHQLGGGKVAWEPVALAHWGTAILNNLTSQLDILVGGLLLSQESLGVYALLKRMTGVVITTQTVEHWKIATPVGIAFARGDTKALQDAIVKGHSATFLAAIFVSMCIVVSAPLWYWFYEFNDALQVTALLVVMLATGLLVLGIGPVLIVASQCGLEGDALVARTVTLVIGVIMAWFGCWMMGVLGLALGFSLSAILMRVLLWLRIRQILKVEVAPIFVYHRLATATRVGG